MDLAIWRSDVNCDLSFFVQGKVIKTKSVEYMPFLLSLVNFLNGSCWTAYALIRFDLYVTVSVNELHLLMLEQNLVELTLVLPLLMAKETSGRVKERYCKDPRA